MATAAIFTVFVCVAAFYAIRLFIPKYEINFDPKTVNISNINKFNQVRNILKDDYYQKVDENTLMEGAVGGLANSLNDPYTVYFNREQMQSFMEKSEGSYVGIGISVNSDTDGILTVIEPFADSPARNAGIIQGDKIIKVDGRDVTAIRDENMVISMIKGKEDTKVGITVFRPSADKSIDFSIVRKKIKISNIKSEIISGNLGYIKLILFDASIAADFTRELDKMLPKGVKGLIIDLRDNPGGSYEQVVAIADRLLPEGLIVYTEDRNKIRQEKMSDKTELNIPVVLLINGNSASASEILAGSVKDRKKGTLVGTKTFGKGLVQELRVLEDGSGIKVTISRYFTPSGVSIQGIGIKPDIETGVGKEYENLPVSQIPRNKDIQLITGIEVLKSKINRP
ncbi:MAG: S41 family peptidase [Ruminiclostridium sp.]|nr:S41 family peptidase [Ruminiclostridium sp.]